MRNKTHLQLTLLQATSKITLLSIKVFLTFSKTIPLALSMKVGYQLKQSQLIKATHSRAYYLLIKMIRRASQALKIILDSL
jgi:hypothetical protein